MKKKTYNVSKKKAPWSDKTNIIPLGASIKNAYFSHYNLTYPKMVNLFKFFSAWQFNCSYCGLELCKKLNN